MKTPQQIVFDEMFEKDAFSKWMGIKILEVDAGFCKAEMVVRSEMLNGFKILHGGISYAFADSIFAFASNSQGLQAVSIETSISHFKKAEEGDNLIGISKLIKSGQKLSTFVISIENQNKECIAHFKGTVFKSGHSW